MNAARKVTPAGGTPAARKRSSTWNDAVNALEDEAIRLRTHETEYELTHTKADALTRAANFLRERCGGP